MRFSAAVIPVCVMLALGVAAPQPIAAQSVSEVGGPAERPPASFSGNQYVDSRGCVFIRAGFGGSTTWVPRVNRAREVLCGYQPSLGARSQVAEVEAPAPQATPTPARTQAQPARPVASAAPAAPQSVANAPRAAAPAGLFRSSTVTTAATAPRRSTTTIVQEPAQPTRVVTVRAAPAATATPATAPAQVISCPGLDPVAQQYLRGAGLRCGPQSTHPGGGVVVAQAGATAQSGAALLRPVQPSVPAGYRPAWEDGRLNPYRGPRTSAGDAQMAAIWTDELPRRQVPGTHVFASLAPQGGFNIRATANDVMRVPFSMAPPRGTSGPVLRSRTVTTPRATPAAPQAAEPELLQTVRVTSGHRFVQVGRYGDQAQARVARDRLAARGLGASIGASNQGGFVVLAGPYGDPQALGRALATARGAGFGGAITRR